MKISFVDSNKKFSGGSFYSFSDVYEDTNKQNHQGTESANLSSSDITSYYVEE